MKTLTQSAFVMGALLYAFTAENSAKKRKYLKGRKRGEERKEKKGLGNKHDVS